MTSSIIMCLYSVTFTIISYLQFLQIELHRVKVHHWEVSVLVMHMGGGCGRGIHSLMGTRDMSPVQVDQKIEVLERCPKHLL